MNLKYCKNEKLIMYSIANDICLEWLFAKRRKK